MRMKVIFSFLVLILPIANCMVWAGVGARYGAGDSMRAVPDYSSMENLGGSADKRAESNPDTTVLDRIKQDGFACRTTPKNVIVKFLQRPLDADKIGLLQSRTGGTAAHVQLVAEIDGKVYENFGLTGSFIKTEKARIFSEKNLDKYDEKKPLGMVRMSFDDYMRARDRTINQATNSYYAPLNAVDPIVTAAVGALTGYNAGGIGGMMSGGVDGLDLAFDAYDKAGRKNRKIVEDDVHKMNFAGFNCQSLVDLFLDNARGEPSFEEIQKYHQPGEIVRETSDDKTDDSDSQQVDIATIGIDTSRIEALLNERIAFLKMLLARGERATRTEVASQNSQKQAMLQELANIVKTIEAFPMPDEEKMRLAEKELAAANKLATQMTSLEGQAVARKLVSLESSNGAVYDTASCMCANPSIEIKPVASSSIPAGVFCKKCGKVVGIAQNGKITRLNHQPKER